MNNKKTVLSFIENKEEYQEKYKDFYEQIYYQEEDNFCHKVNKFLDLKYTPQEINDIYNYVRYENREKMLEMEKINIKNYYSIPNFDVDNILRYEQYQNNKNTTLTETVLKVNMNLDYKFYTKIDPITNKDSYTVLVNKYHSLGKYEPIDLKSLEYDTKYKLRAKASVAFKKLLNAAKKENVFLKPYSAYRSYEYQKELYNHYVEKDGRKLADTYSARPGHSEHQTGLAVDVWSEGFQDIEQNDAIWLRKNSYKYGFIIRYTKENEEITGYMEEPWHLRYLGIDIATDVYKKGITYDEYYDLYIK